MVFEYKISFSQLKCVVTSLCILAHSNLFKIESGKQVTVYLFLNCYVS